MSSALFDSDRLPLSKSVREKLLVAFRRAAREEGLSSGVTDRYEAWCLAFLSWCLGSPPRPARPEQIGDFRKALERAGTDEDRICEAMDALAFFFGAVGADDILSSESVGRSGPRTIELSVPRADEPLEDDELRTIRIGWQAETGDQGEEQSSMRRQSTAELCLEHYQAQIEALHGPGTNERSTG